MFWFQSCSFNSENNLVPSQMPTATSANVPNPKTSSHIFSNDITTTTKYVYRKSIQKINKWIRKRVRHKTNRFFGYTRYYASEFRILLSHRRSLSLMIANPFPHHQELGGPNSAALRQGRLVKRRLNRPWTYCCARNAEEKPLRRKEAEGQSHKPFTSLPRILCSIRSCNMEFWCQ